jgi:endonuclease YncB( thermonuclease family)
MTDRSLATRLALVLVAAVAAAAVVTQFAPDDGQVEVAAVNYAPVTPVRVEPPKPPPKEPDSVLTPSRRAARLGMTLVIDGQIDPLEATVFRNAQTVIRLRHLAGLARDAVCHGQDGLPWNCGLQARSALITALRSDRVRCQPALDAPGEKDSFQCWVGGQDLSRLLIRSGWARPLRLHAATYAAELDAAMAAKSGLWRGTLPRGEGAPVSTGSDAASTLREPAEASGR